MKLFFVEIEIRGESLVLCAEKCLLRPANNSLYIADAHIGKSNHFRKAGIAVPSQLIFEEVNKLHLAIDKYQVETIYFLGDLFHSVKNESVEILSQLIAFYEDKNFILVKGNHDIMPDISMIKTGLQLANCIEDDLFLFTHEKTETEKFNFFGHLHPAINLTGMGRQNLRLPCFVFTENYAILPAFGVFTGMATISDDDSIQAIYVIAEEEVICVKG